MAFIARIMILKESPNAAAILDRESNSYCLRLPSRGGEEWSAKEIAKATDCSAKLGCRVGLVYVECFGGVCDHWARIYESGKEVVRYDEHPSLPEIFSAVGVMIPASGYYSPLDLTCNPDLPRMPE